MKIGLTGGMGCGKSTVGGLFEKRGYAFESADAIVHGLLKGDQSVIGEVVALLGTDVLDAEGGIDRSAVAKRVFSDATCLEKLEAILHPRVRQVWEAVAEARGNCVIEIPLLFEKKLQKNVDLTICVFSDPNLQVERLKLRGLSREEASARMDRQMPLSDKAQLADHVLLNDGSLEFLEEQVVRLTSKIETLYV